MNKNRARQRKSDYSQGMDIQFLICFSTLLPIFFIQSFIFNAIYLSIFSFIAKLEFSSLPCYKIVHHFHLYCLFFFPFPFCIYIFIINLGFAVKFSFRVSLYFSLMSFRLLYIIYKKGCISLRAFKCECFIDLISPRS